LVSHAGDSFVFSALIAHKCPRHYSVTAANIMQSQRFSSLSECTSLAGPVTVTVTQYPWTWW
jgi:hypothetical protein